MKMIDDEFGFEESIKSGVVDRIFCRYDGNCRIYYNDKSYKQLKIMCSFYNSQYGIPISKDGTTLFVGSWENGLTAYDVISGGVLWKYKPGRVRNILVFSDFLIISRANTAVEKIDVKTGELLASIRSGTLERVFDLGFPFIFADTISGKHCIIDILQMEIIKKYSSKTVNPNRCLSIIITDVVLKNNSITISGTEQYPNKHFDAKVLDGTEAFSRVIDNSFDTLMDKK